MLIFTDSGESAEYVRWGDIERIEFVTAERG